jgi:hypothetical protein
MCIVLDGPLGRKEREKHSSLICGCALHLVPICLCGQVGRRGRDNTPRASAPAAVIVLICMAQRGVAVRLLSWPSDKGILENPGQIFVILAIICTADWRWYVGPPEHPGH